jgi:hypothetical protein
MKLDREGLSRRQLVMILASVRNSETFLTRDLLAFVVGVTLDD